MLAALRMIDLLREWGPRVFSGTGRGPWWSAAAAWLRHGARYFSLHTGVPALIVAAVLVALGYRLLKRSVRFLMEVTVIASALVAMTELGWIRW